MTFDELTNAVLANGFGESHREMARRWVNQAYQWVWDAEQWSFRTGLVSVTVTAGSPNVGSLPTDFGIVTYLLNEDGEPLRAIEDVRQFLALYGDGAEGDPEAFTVIGAATIRVGPTPASSATYQLLHEKFALPLSGGTDSPSIPSGYHMAIVHKGRAIGFKQLGIPIADGSDENAMDMLEAMRQSYLSPVRGEVEQIGAFRPDGW